MKFKIEYQAIALSIVALVLLPALAMLLWNWLMPHIFNLSEIDYWEAFGLIILARLFFYNKT